MRFEPALQFGTLIKRFQRFFAEIELESGQRVLAHCPNSGSMKSVNVPGARVAVSDQPSPARKLHYTWELIHVEGGWVGVNTLLANGLVAEALENGLIPAFRRYKNVRREVSIAEDTRIDFTLGTTSPLWLEVKNVTLVENGVARFPDSVTARGKKHLNHLMAYSRRSGKSAMLYVVQHHAAHSFEPADDLDPVYGKTLRQAADAGVKIEAWKASVSPQEIRLREKLPVKLN